MGYYYILGVEQTENATRLDKFIIPNKSIAIVLGHEVDGVSQKVINQCDETIEIPQFGTKHSLNISVSTGIVIWELWNKLNA